MQYSDIARRVQVARELKVRAASKGVMPYLHELTIDARPEPLPFSQLADPWQWTLAEQLGQMVEFAAGNRPDYDGPRNAMIVLPRGHDKTSSLGRLINWAIRFGKVPIRGAVAAEDEDQASLLREAMDAELKLNPWLKYQGDQAVLRYTQKQATGPGGFFRVLPADAPGEWGGRQSIIILDELTHWTSRDLWTVVWSGREKVPNSIFIIITNAGILKSWQHDIYLGAKDNPSWFFFEAPPKTTLASWMTQDKIDELRQFLTLSEAKRVLDNIWIDAAEEAGYLTRADVTACEQLGSLWSLSRVFGPRPSTDYYVGIDYGPKRDRTALCVLHFDEDRRAVVIDQLDVLQGSPDSPIQIETVDTWLDDVCERFRPRTIVIDPYQMEGTIQRYEKRFHVERFEARGGKRNYEMAEHLRALVVNHRLAWYPGAGNLLVDGRWESLADELAGLVTKETSYGYRFDHTIQFHDDRAVAIGMPALACCRDLPEPWLAPPEIERDKPQHRDERESKTPTEIGPDDLVLKRPGPDRWELFGVG